MTLPPAAVGVFSLENIKLAAGLELPLLTGKPLVDFSFAERAHPFLLTVSLLLPAENAVALAVAREPVKASWLDRIGRCETGRPDRVGERGDAGVHVGSFLSERLAFRAVTRNAPRR